MNKSMYGLALAMLLLPVCAHAADITVKVTNTENVQRQELIEIDAKIVYQKMGLAKGETFVVKNALSQETSYQITHDGKILITIPTTSITPKASSCILRNDSTDAYVLVYAWK